MNELTHNKFLTVYNTFTQFPLTWKFKKKSKKSLNFVGSQGKMTRII